MKSEKIDQLATALMKFQSDVPVIKKDKIVKNKDGSVRYQYANLETIMEVIRPKMKEHGLAVSQSVSPNGDKGFTLNSILMHISGQYLSSSYPLDTQGTEQEIGSSMTYSRRYSLCAILGIVTEDDDDGLAATEKKAPYIKPMERPVGYIAPNDPTIGIGANIDRGYRIPFGKFAKRSLEEVDAKQLGDYVSYLETSADKKGEKLKGVVLDFVERAVEYLGALEGASLNGQDIPF